MLFLKGPSRYNNEPLQQRTLKLMQSRDNKFTTDASPVIEMLLGSQAVALLHSFPPHACLQDFRFPHMPPNASAGLGLLANTAYSS